MLRPTIYVPSRQPTPPLARPKGTNPADAAPASDRARDKPEPAGVPNAPRNRSSKRCDMQIFGTHDENTRAARQGRERARRVALMADGHVGYVMPIGGSRRTQPGVGGRRRVRHRLRQRGDPDRAKTGRLGKTAQWPGRLETWPTRSPPR